MELKQAQGNNPQPLQPFQLRARPNVPRHVVTDVKIDDIQQEHNPQPVTQYPVEGGILVDAAEFNGALAQNCSVHQNVSVDILGQDAPVVLERAIFIPDSEAARPSYSIFYDQLKALKSPDSNHIKAIMHNIRNNQNGDYPGKIFDTAMLAIYDKYCKQFPNAFAQLVTLPGEDFINVCLQLDGKDIDAKMDIAEFQRVSMDGQNRLPETGLFTNLKNTWNRLDPTTKIIFKLGIFLVGSGGLWAATNSLDPDKESSRAGYEVIYMAFIGIFAITLFYMIGAGVGIAQDGLRAYRGSQRDDLPGQHDDNV